MRREVPDPPAGLRAAEPREWTRVWARVLAEPSVKHTGLALIIWADYRTGANILTFESGGQDLRARIEVALDVHDRKQLERILSGVKRIPGVFDIERVYNV